MSDHRKPILGTKHGYEDFDLFRGQTVKVAVELIPQVGRNSCDDIIIKGFVSGGGAIDVVFSGRRRKYAETLQVEIESMWSKEWTAARKLEVPLEAEDVRYPIQVEGAWYPEFTRDEEGWETRRYRLYAASWVAIGQNGEVRKYGEPVAQDE